MIVFFDGSFIFFWKRTKNGLGLLNDTFDVRLGSPCKGTVRITEEVTPSVVGDLPNTLELVLAEFEFSEEVLGLFHHDGEIVNIDADVFIVGPTVLHPNVGIRKARREEHSREGVGKLFVIASPAGAEAIEGLDDDEDMPLAIAKFWFRDNVDLFFRVGLEIGIADVGSFDLETIEFGKEHAQA
jgi:hypothetical protein